MPITAGQTIGINAATAGINAGFGLLGTLINNRLARDNAEHDREENYKYNEMAAEAADARTRKLYADLYSPGAQLQQLKDAGLSPSVFYANGAGGISGQTGSQGAGVGVQQQTFGLNALDASQIALNNAQARKLNAEADTEQGINEKGRAVINNILQNTATAASQEGLNESATCLNNLESSLKDIEIRFKEQTFWTDVAAVNNACEKLEAEAYAAWSAARKEAKEAEFAEDVYEERISQFKQQGVLLGRKILLADSEIQLNAKKMQELDAIIEKTYNDISYEWSQLQLDSDKLDWDKQNEYVHRQERIKERNLKRLELKLKQRDIEIRHADRKARMFISTLNTCVTAFGIGSMKNKAGKTIVEHYNPNGTSNGWDVTIHE